MKSKSKIKLLLISALILLILSNIYISYVKLPIGYEISLFSSFSLVFWVLIIMAFILITIVVLWSGIYDKSNWWILGIILLIYINITILLLPLLLGYFAFGRGDILTHIGWANDILQYGHIAIPGSDAEDYYPVLHIQIAILNMFTGIPTNIISMIIPIFYNIIYTSFMFLLAKEISNKKIAIFVALISLVLMFKYENLMSAPSVLALFVLPMLLFLFYSGYNKKANSTIFTALFVVLLLYMPFLHPGEGTTFLIPIFVCIFLSITFFSRKYKLPKNILNKNRMFSIVSLIIISWFTWFMSFYAFSNQLKSIFDWYFSEIGTTNLVQYSNLLNQANLSINEFINLIFKIYGDQIIIIGLGFFVCAYFLIKFIKNKALNINEFTFSILLIVFIAIVGFSFSNNTGVEGIRGLRYLIFISTFLVAFGFYILYDKYNKKAVLACFLVLIMITTPLGILNVFPSPDTKNFNFQVTKMEISGTAWFNENRDSSYLIHSINSKQVLRFSDAESRNGTIQLYSFMRNSPEHFNYTNNTYYNESSYYDFYYIDWKLNRIFYPEVFPEYKKLWKYTPSDFNNLDKNDNSVSKIYENGEFWTYFV